MFVEPDLTISGESSKSSSNSSLDTLTSSTSDIFPEVGPVNDELSPTHADSRVWKSLL